MKHTKKLAIVALLVALLTLCACGRNDDMDAENQRGDANARDVGIHEVENGDFKGALIDEINLYARSRSIGETKVGVEFGVDEARATNQVHRISDIREFYYPNVEIPGFELHGVSVNLGRFLFFYVPQEPSDRQYDINGKYVYGSTEIRVTIDRLCSFTASAAELFNEIGENFSMSTVLIGENMLYSEIAGLLHVLSGDMLISIVVPDKNQYILTEDNRIETIYDRNMNCPDFLRDLALQVIETAELVTV